MGWKELVQHFEGHLRSLLEPRIVEWNNGFETPGMYRGFRLPAGISTSSSTSSSTSGSVSSTVSSPAVSSATKKANQKIVQTFYNIYLQMNVTRKK